MFEPQMEKYLQNSGLKYTILRPGCFMEVWLSATEDFDAMNGKVNLCRDGAKPVAYISVKDVAKFAVEFIAIPTAMNEEIEPGGPGNINQEDVVKIFEEVTHKKIEVQHIPIEDLQAQFDSDSDSMQKSFTGLMLYVAKGNSIDKKEVPGKFPVKLTSVEDFRKIHNEEQG